MFDKVLASFGLGSARVDTRLEKATYRQGDTVGGSIFVQGGKAEQTIDSIYLYLILQNHLDEQQDEYILDEILLTDSFQIGRQETKVIPFEFQLPYDTPVTSGGSSIYLKTGLDVKMAVDPGDLDGFEVLPSLLVDEVLKVVEHIGFQLHTIEFDYDMFHARHPFVQKYRMVPRGEYAEIMDEMKLIFNPAPHQVDVMMQVDNKAVDLRSAVEEVLKIDERIHRFTINQHDLNILDVIKSHIQKCISS